MLLLPMPRASLISIACLALLSCSSEQPGQGAAPQDAAPMAGPAQVPGSPKFAPGSQPATVAANGKRIESPAIPDACRYDGLGDAIATARARWQGMGINSYSMTIQRSSFHQLAAWPNSKPLKLTVRDGIPTGNLPRVDASWLQSLTVDGLFAYVETEAAKHPDCLVVGFDPMFGYPASIRIDPEISGADDELEFSVTEFGP